MGMTSFYMGSLRYGPTGKRRKNHFANAAKKKPITGFKKHIPEKSQLDIMREEQAKQYKSLMEEAMKDGTWISQSGDTAKKENMKYTGTLVKGIATMHKSNAVPVINQQEAEDIAKMRRG
tara:strand:+ start:169 stop:528 length:360 start_codon:yes stop_codon:yes gene_type:complete